MNDQPMSGAPTLTLDPSRQVPGNADRFVRLPQDELSRLQLKLVRVLAIEVVVGRRFAHINGDVDAGLRKVLWGRQKTLRRCKSTEALCRRLSFSLSSGSKTSRPARTSLRISASERIIGLEC